MGAGMILQAEAVSGDHRTGHRCRTPRRARPRAAGHLPAAGPSRLAWALERRLFDHGYAVHVIREPESLRQAVRTALAAGLVAIVAPAAPADWDVVRQAVPAEQRVRVENVQQGMEAVARVGRSESSLTGGDGI